MPSRFGRHLARGAVALLALSTFAAPPRAHAFCPNNGWRCAFGGAGTTHKDITKDALKQLDEEFFATSRMTKGMKDAIEQIWEANAEVDENQTESARHFDGENFGGGKSRVVNLEANVVSALQGEDGSGARRALGQALHTIQDFYSHSNFIERGGSGAYSPIWDMSPISPIAARNAATCRDCTLVPLPDGTVLTDCSSNITTSQLTTGYYGGEDSVPAVAGKCRHGGILDGGPGPFGGINKDTIFETFSPHNLQHRPAANGALEATKAFVRDIKDKVTRRQLKLLLGVGPTLAMSIDTTGSMGGVIASVRSQAINIVNARIDTEQEPIQYVLAPFNDPGVGPLTVTDDPAVFRAAISALGASGGGDCPELSMTGALQALSAADEGVDLFTFTDADALDAGLSGAVASLEAAKDADVYPMLFGFCGGFLSSMDTQTSTQFGIAASAAPSRLASLPIDPSYERIASAGGGQVFFLNGFEAGQITRLADAVVRANSVDLLAVADSYGTSAKSYTVAVDSSLERVTFSLSGSTTLTIKRPDGTTVLSTDANVQTIPLSTGSIVTVLTPAAGLWTASTNGIGTFTLRVLGDSQVSFDRFDFVEIRARGGHEGYFPLEGFPVIGEGDLASAELTGSFGAVDFEFRDRAANLIEGFTLGQEPGGSADEFYGPATLPTQPFVVYAKGTLGNGEAFQRLLTKTVEPQTVRVFAPVGHDVAPGSTTFYTFTIKNFGDPNTFRLTASDNRRYVTGLTASSFALATGESIDVTIRLDIPAGAPVGKSDTLTVSVESQAPTGARNFAVVESSIVEKPLVVVSCEQAVPSVLSIWPPNHGLEPVDVIGVTASDGSAVDIRVDGILQSEATNAAGSGNTCPDGSGLGTPTALVRAERSGNGPGRVVEIAFTASTATGGECQGQVRVCVPHDKKDVCPDLAPTFDATVCN